MRFYCYIGLLLFFLSSYSQDISVIYVSNEGNNMWSGQLSEPNDSKTDGPVKTIEAAKSIVMQLMPKNYDTIKVVIREGVYVIDKAISHISTTGSASSYVVYESFPGEWARIRGGIEVQRKNIKTINSETYSFRIDNTYLKGKTLINEKGLLVDLIYKDEPLKWASSPEPGWNTIESFETNGADITNLKVEGTPPLISSNNLWVGGYWSYDWDFTYQKVSSYNGKSIELTPPNSGYGYRKNQRFRFYNVEKEISNGSFVVKPEDSEITFAQKELENSGLYLSIYRHTLMQFRNQSNIVLRRLILEGTVGDVLSFNNCTNIVVKGCLFRNILGRPIVINEGENIEINSCLFKNLGSTAIYVDAGNRKKLIPSNHRIINNAFSDFARYRKTYQPAIDIHGVGVTVKNNLIENAPHSGIILAGNNHIIEYNELRNLATETGDVGLIYIGRDWSYRGNIIRHNYLHSSVGYGDDGVAAIYLDDFISGTQVIGNTICGIDYGLLIGGGQYNIVDGNYFYNCKKAAVHIDNRGETWAKEYIKPGGKWKMWAKLDKVNFKQKPFSESYPELLLVNEINYMLPQGNKLSNNKFQGKWIDFEKKPFYSIVELQGNEKQPVDNKQEQCNIILKQLDLKSETTGTIPNTILDKLRKL